MTLEQEINGRKYSFDKEKFEIKVDDRTIKLDSVYHNEDNGFQGIYVCSCDPDRNSGRISEDEEYLKPCNHIQNLRDDGYLTNVVKKLYDAIPKDKKSDFIFLWEELLEARELRELTDLVMEEIIKPSS